MTNYIFSGRTHADVNLCGLDSQNGLCPAMPPLGIRSHLSLINHRNIITFIEIRHLHRGGCHPAVLLGDALLSGQHGAGHTVLRHFLVDLQGQKTQRAQIHPIPGIFQPFQRLKSLAAVRRTDMQDKMPSHLERFRKLQLRPRGHQLQNLILQGLCPKRTEQIIQRSPADLAGRILFQIFIECRAYQPLVLRKQQRQIQPYQLWQYLPPDAIQHRLKMISGRTIPEIIGLTVIILQGIPGDLAVFQALQSTCQTDGLLRGPLCLYGGGSPDLSRPLVLTPV